MLRYGQEHVNWLKTHEEAEPKTPFKLFGKFGLQIIFWERQKSPLARNSYLLELPYQYRNYREFSFFWYYPFKTHTLIISFRKPFSRLTPEEIIEA